MNVRRPGQANRPDGDVVVDAAIDQQGKEVIRHAGITVNAAIVFPIDIASVLSIGHFTGVAIADGMPHVANRAAKGWIIFAGEPAVGGVIGRRSLAQCRATASSAHGVGGVGATVVEQIDDFAPNIGIRFIECARLPGIDQVAGILGVGVRPFMGHRIIAGDAVAIIGRDAIPVSIRTLDLGVIIHGAHDGILAIVGKPGAIGEAVEEVVGLLGAGGFVVPGFDLGHTAAGPTIGDWIRVAVAFIPNFVV